MKASGTTQTDLTLQDLEGRLPKVPESITSAASFACLETLGVLPPPEEGWLPRTTSEQNDKEEEVMWWANVMDQDWIYNGIEDKYFHLPTRSLWEKRDLESRDPYAPPYTFLRLDAMALEALRQFAGSVDRTLVPMVFQAWMRVVAKERRTNKAPSGPSKSSSQGVAKPPPLPVSVLPNFEEAVEVEVKPPQKEAAPEVQEEVPRLPSALPEDKPVSSSSKPRRRKSFCFCVFARFGRSEEDEAMWEGTTLGGRGGEEARTPSTSAGSSAASQVRSAKDAPPMVKGSEGGTVPTAATTAVTSPKKDELSAAEAAVKNETAELHERRLEQFLNEVKKNPQRLVAHVEKRRSEKTGMAFLI